MKRFVMSALIPFPHRTATPFALAALLCGCAATPPAAPTVAAVAEVETLSTQAKAYPRFSEIPELPTDMRPLAAWGRAAQEIMADGAALEREGAEMTWTLGNTEAFASGAQSEAGPPALAVSATAAAEAFAREIRRRATPPPPSSR